MLSSGSRLALLGAAALGLLGVACAAPRGTPRALRSPAVPHARQALPSGGPVDFARDIQPLLARKCIACHGAAVRQGGLRLDLKADALRGGNSGAAIRPGDSAGSLLVRYVAGLDPKIVMPPSGERLAPAEVAALRLWIDQGAPWPEAGASASARAPAAHWAFVPPRRPAVPPPASRVPGRNPAWIRNPIDAFILARLEQEQIAPSPEADRATLIRRLCLDLLGLPPSLAEVEAFVRDPRPDAYERLVDRLLASPHYGERWGRHWLDLARYADSDGYEKDSPRPYAYFYRDWVIHALNRDLPFDRFTIEQLAGDLLPDATLQQKTATGFHRNTLTNREGGVDPEEFRIKAVVDRVNTTGSVWLGLTVGCAECHDHKYDPISQREYYGLFAFFNRAREVDLPNPTPEELAAYAKAKQAHDAEAACLQAAVATYEQQELPARREAWERSVRGPAPVWTVLRPESAVSSGQATLTVLPDGSVQATGLAPAVDSYTITVKTALTGITAFRLEVLTEPGPGQDPARRGGLPPGNFVLSELRVQVAASARGATPAAVPLENPTATIEEKTGPVLKALDGNPRTGWDVRAQPGQLPTAVFETRESPAAAGERTLTFVLEQQGGQQRTIDRFRLSATTAPRPVWAAPPPAPIADILAVPASARTAEQQAELAKFYRGLDPGLRALEDTVAEHAKKAPPEPPAKIHALAADPAALATHVHVRGDFLRKGDPVTPHTPAVLHRMRPAADTRAKRGYPPDRLDLARWLVDPGNPLTARVTVNRIWQHLFGRGLVATENDFGTRGEPPSHPELLDWLALAFMATRRNNQPSTIDHQPSTIGHRSSDPYACAWSMKALLRLIVTSATYRQSSRHRADLAERDPKNVLLARQNRFRVEAEIVRDLFLAVSGLLNRTIGGPSIRPPLPPDVAALSYASGLKWEETKGPERYRRGMYIHWQRTVPFPSLMAFDAPDGNVTCTRRERSNSPLQALTLLNDPIFFECARALGRRILTEETRGTGARLRHAFRLCLARDPTPTELARLTKLYGEMSALCRKDPDAAAKLLDGKPPAGESVAEAAAWVTIARALMNLDEFVTRE